MAEALEALVALEASYTTEQIKTQGVWPYKSESNYTKQSFFNSFIDISGDLIIQSGNELIVGGDASLNSKLFVGGDVSFSSNFIVQGTSNLIGDVLLNSKLLVANDV